MDPDACLEEIRDKVAWINGATASYPMTDPSMIARVGEELSEYVEALDGWISGGGHLPKAWL